MTPHRTDSAVTAVVATLAGLSRTGGDWIETGVVADALGTSVAEAAAQLRAASRRGLCGSRRSLVHGTVWRVEAAGRPAEPGN